MKSVQRAILILKLLEMGQKPTANDIAQRFRTSIRTAYRDLNMLKGLNIPLRQVDGFYSLNKSAWSRWTNRHIPIGFIHPYSKVSRHCLLFMVMTKGGIFNLTSSTDFILLYVGTFIASAFVILPPGMSTAIVSCIVLLST